MGKEWCSGAGEVRRLGLGGGVRECWERGEVGVHATTTTSTQISFHHFEPVTCRL